MTKQQGKSTRRKAPPRKSKGASPALQTPEPDKTTKDEIASAVETEPRLDPDLGTAPSLEKETDIDTADYEEIVRRYEHHLPVVSSGRSVDRYDPVRAYLHEIRRYPLLSIEEERAITREFYEHRSEKSAQVLVLANLRLVVKIAFTYIHTGFKLLDLIQEGNIGLLQAVKQYNPYKGAKFSYYASFWIKAYIQNFILKNWSLVKIGTTQAQRRLFYNLKKEKQLLEEQGFTVTPKLLSERLNIAESDVVEMDQRLAARDLSLDQPLSDESSTNLIDLLATENPHVLENLERDELQQIFNQKLKEFGATLEGKERLIFEKRLLGDPPLTLQEIGEQYGITRERVRQVENRLIQKLKEFVKTDLPID